MTTITLRVPTLRDATRAAACDWAPHLRRWAGLIAIPLVATYAAGLWTGDRWHRLLAILQRHHLLGLARLGLPGGGQAADLPLAPLLSTTRPAPVIVQRQAPAPPPTLSRRDACRRLRARGLSPAAIGRELGISRSTVCRELAAG